RPFHALTARAETYTLSLHDALPILSGSILEFARIHEYFGIHFDQERNGWIYREWAPAAYQLFFFGDFNNWDRYNHPMTKDPGGVDRKSTRLNSSHVKISYAVFCLKK